MFSAVLSAITYSPLVRIHIGPLSISPHGIATAVGFAAGARLMLPAARARGLSDELVYRMLTRAAVGAILGARFFYVANNLGEFDSPTEWFKVWEGGISLLGGIFGAIVANIALFRRERVGFYRVMDAAVPGLALGIVIGRIGDLVIADHLGGRTDLPFGFRCPDVVDVGRTVGSPCPPGEVVHLTAAYDLIAATLVLITLLVVRRRPRPEGLLTLLGALVYALGRFGFDFMREDTRRLGLTGSQWVAVGLIVVAATLLARRSRTGRGADALAGEDNRPPHADRPPASRSG